MTTRLDRIEQEAEAAARWLGIYPDDVLALCKVARAAKEYVDQSRFGRLRCAWELDINGPRKPCGFCPTCKFIAALDALTGEEA